MNISGSLYRNMVKWAEFRRKRTNSNPKQGPFHYRAPSKILWRPVRGMVPYKTARGAAAMDRLKTHDGIPHPYDKKKRMVVPQALKILRLKPNRKFCSLGDLSSSAGWKCKALLERLEAKRKVRAAAYFTKRKALEKTKVAAVKAAKLEKSDQDILAKYGY